jgi:3-deoxy-D-manno-octulosonic-acid transferase/heptosyltransferase-1
LNILIVKLSAIGDVIHTLPALVALRRRYPDAHISWLVEEAGAGLIEGHTALNRVVVWRRREFQNCVRRLHWFKAAGLFASALRRVRDRPYDLVIDFQALLKSAMWVMLAKGTRKVGFGRGMDHSEGSYLALNERVPPVSMEVHALDRGLILLEHLGVPRGDLDYQLPHDPQAEAEVDAFLARAKVSGTMPLVVIHPVARWRTKLWFNDRFAALADALQDRGVAVVFSGSSADAAMLDEISGFMKRPCLRFDGRAGLRHLAALCRRAQVVVSTDTGPMHVAAAVGTRVVGLFGPTAPNRTGPYGPEHHILRAGVPCSPCFKRRCESRVVEAFGCMKRIEVTQVLNTVMDCLLEAEAGPIGSAAHELPPSHAVR